MGIEGAVEGKGIGRKERRASSISSGLLIVQVYSDIEGVANEGTFLLRGGGGGRIVQDREGWKV